MDLENNENNEAYAYSSERKSYAELLAEVERLQNLVNEAKTEIETMHSYIEDMANYENENKPRSL